MNTFTKQQPSNARRKKTTAQQKNITLTFTDSVSVPEEFYEKIKRDIIFYLPHTRNSDYFVPEDMITFWTHLSDEEQYMGRACIAHLSATKVLPIKPLDWAFEYSSFYVSR